MAMTTDLLLKLNRVQDFFSTLRWEPIELPKIVVVGSQSAGKSSVLESLVKKSFLPRGTGIVTRCPLVLQLNHCPVGDARRKGIDLQEWGTFLHSDRIFRLEDVCEEIEAQTSRMAGSNKGIVSTPITLKVFSPHVVDLTLVDLPGITKVPIGDQPDDIEQQIEDLIYHYIENPLTIILAVVTANTDMATCESIKLAKEVDPQGERTLAVVTKIDLMDQGTSADEILKGNVIPVKLGLVGVVNRSQKDINDKKNMEDALEYERKFFAANYKDVASKAGSPYLAKTLSVLLSDHIDKSLPGVQGQLHAEIDKLMKILKSCGQSIQDPKTALMSIINKFNMEFSSLCKKGKLQKSNLSSLTGGAKICDILHVRLPRIFAECEPCKAYRTEEVVMAIRQSNGTTPPFFVSEDAFEMLVTPLIEKMQKPALECVEDIKREMNNMCQLSMPEHVSQRFPRLKQAIASFVEGIIDKTAQKPIQMVKDLVSMETGHITYYRMHYLNDGILQVLSQKDIQNYRLPFRGETLWERQSGHDACYWLVECASEHQPQPQLLQLSSKDIKHVINLGTMLDHYYKIVASAMQDATAKAVVTFLVKEVQQSLNTELCAAFLAKEDLEDLFVENGNIAVTRKETLEKLEVLEKSLQVINNGFCDDSPVAALYEKSAGGQACDLPASPEQGRARRALNWALKSWSPDS